MRTRIPALVGAALLALSAPGRAHAEETVPLSRLDLSKAVQGFGKPQADRSVDNHPLTLHGQTFATGFGTHSPGVLVIDLKGGTRRFTATVGIDDEVPDGKGSANFQVLGDGRKLLWQSGILRRGSRRRPSISTSPAFSRSSCGSRPAATATSTTMPTGRTRALIVTGAPPQTVAWKPTVMEPAIAMPPPIACSAYPCACRRRRSARERLCSGRRR